MQNSADEMQTALILQRALRQKSTGQTTRLQNEVRKQIQLLRKNKR